jgi:ABC-2 type transport system ATP-binding protein
MRSDLIIETHYLRRTFKAKAGDVEAVAGVTLGVAAGDIFGFLGPNGAGKTTTLRILATLLPPTSGQATVAGFDVARRPDQVRRQIATSPSRAARTAAPPGARSSSFRAACST